jgi:hypothetical protein
MRVTLLNGALPADANVHYSDPWPMSKLPSAAEYLMAQARYTYEPASSGFHYTLVNDTHAASAVKVTVVDTTPSITAGTVRVIGLVADVVTVEDIDISAGAGVYTTAEAAFTEIILVKSFGLATLGGSGDETIAAEWDTGAESIVDATNLVEQTENFNVFLQTTLDGGATWCDIANFHFQITSAVKVSAIKITTALAANTTPTSAGMSADAILSGLLGDFVRLAYVAEYAFSGSAIVVDVVVH